MKNFFSCLFHLILIQGVSFAQTWADTTTLIEKVFEKYKPTHPGCQVAISRKGEIIFSRAWGMADMEHYVPLTTGSVIEAGSISKQFTAAAISSFIMGGKQPYALWPDGMLNSRYFRKEVQAGVDLLRV